MIRGAERSRPGNVIIRLPMASIETCRPIVIGRSAHDVVRRLLAGAVAVAHDAAAAPGRPVKTIEKRRRQLKIGLKLFDRHFDRAC